MKKKHLFIALVISIMFCLPYFLTNQINIGSDTAFHMNRIESLLTSIRNGVIYPYIFPNQNYYFGYGSPLFYSIIPLYPLALLRMTGFSIYSTWVIAIFVICFLSSLTIQYALEKVINKPKTYSLLLTSYLYIHSVYRYSKVFKVGALQEFAAVIIMPLVFIAINEVIYEKKNSYLELGFSFTILLLTHNLSFAIMCVILGIIIIFNIGNVTKEMFVTILKGTVIALLISTFYLLPLWEQTRMGIFLVNNYSSETMMTMSLKELLSVFSNAVNIDSGIGLALLVIPLFIVKDKKYRWISLIGLLLVVLTQGFVWDIIPFSLGLLQFTTRLLSVAIMFLSLATGIVVNKINRLNIVTIIVAISTCETVVANVYTQYNLINNF